MNNDKNSVELQQRIDGFFLCAGLFGQKILNCLLYEIHKNRLAKLPLILSILSQEDVWIICKGELLMSIKYKVLEWLTKIKGNTYTNR